MTRALPGLGQRIFGWLGLAAVPLLALLSACTDVPGDIGTGLPAADANSGAYLIDTLTVRVSTVLQDSVDTSTPAYLLVGRYHDDRLGNVSATSYFQLGFTGSYVASPSEVYDSLALDLTTDAFRYADTTKLQTVEVHRLRTAPAAGQTYYAFNELPYEAAVLNQGALANRPFRARAGLHTLRLRLADALGRELLAAGRLGTLSSSAQLDALVAGLALVPGATDDAALLRIALANTTSTLRLYTHEPSDPATALTQSFPLSYGTRHFSHVAADRTGTLLAPLTQAQPLPVARTAQEIYLDGALGLKARLEIPYLITLRDYGSHLALTSARLELEAVPGTASTFLAPPARLSAYLSDRGNRPGLALSSSIAYATGQSLRTGLDTGGYALDLTAYCQAVIDRSIENNGLLLSSAVPESPARVVLGGPLHRASPLRLKVYFVR